MAIKSLTSLLEDKPVAQVANQSVSDEAINRARKDYYDTISYLKAKGISVNKELALKIKTDLINNQSIMQF